MPNAERVLFIDDEMHVRMAGQQTLELAGYRVDCFDSATSALTEIADDFPGVVVSDVRMPGLSGMDFLTEALKRDAELPIVLITGHGDIAMAVAAIHAGAYDFLEKPFSSDRLLDTVARAMDRRRLVLENRALRRDLEAAAVTGSRIVGSNPKVAEVRRMIATLAPINTDILINGETGTGKEVVARALHDQSPRREANFVALNCGAMPETMIETELFGHEAGAFTGATGRRIGKIEHASGGTLFLDEIESMPMNLQVRLLRVLQERSVERLGSNTPIPLDLRVVAATKVDLRTAADEGTFRADLYYRLNVITIDLPPLRERRDDVRLLFHHFLLDAATRYSKSAPAVGPDVLARLSAHDWPGNVRELRNIADRFVLMDGALTALPGSPGAPSDPAGSGVEIDLTEQLATFERSLIAEALGRHGGSVQRAAVALGVPRKTLHDKMKRLDLDRQDFTSGDAS